MEIKKKNKSSGTDVVVSANNTNQPQNSTKTVQPNAVQTNADNISDSINVLKTKKNISTPDIVNIDVHTKRDVESTKYIDSIKKKAEEYREGKVTDKDYTKFLIATNQNLNRLLKTNTLKELRIGYDFVSELLLDILKLLFITPGNPKDFVPTTNKQSMFDKQRTSQIDFYNVLERFVNNFKGFKDKNSRKEFDTLLNNFFKEDFLLPDTSSFIRYTNKKKAGISVVRIHTELIMLLEYYVQIIDEALNKFIELDTNLFSSQLDKDLNHSDKSFKILKHWIFINSQLRTKALHSGSDLMLNKFLITATKLKAVDHHNNYFYNREAKLAEWYCSSFGKVLPKEEDPLVKTNEKVSLLWTLHNKVGGNYRIGGMASEIKFKDSFDFIIYSLMYLQKDYEVLDSWENVKNVSEVPNIKNKLVLNKLYILKNTCKNLQNILIGKTRTKGSLKTIHINNRDWNLKKQKI